MGMKGSRFYGAVAKDRSGIRGVQWADGKEMAEELLMAGWTDRLKALYDILPVTVTVDERPDGAASVD